MYKYPIEKGGILLIRRRIIACLMTFIIVMQLCVTISYGIKTNSNRVIKVGIDPSIPPFQYLENGEITGLNVAILNSIANDNDFKIEYIPMSKDIGVEKLRKDEIDMILGIRYDANLSSEFEYTEGVVQSVVCMLVRTNEQDDIQSNLGKRYYLASVENNSAELVFLNNLRRVNFNVAFNQEDAFQLLMMDRADFLLGVRDTVEFLINKHDVQKDYTIIDSYTTPVDYLIAVKGGNRNLLNMLNSGLSRLKLSGEYENLYFRWVENSEANIEKKLNSIIEASLLGAIVAAILFILAFIWNRKLKQQVRIKTGELIQSNSELEDQIIETRNNIELKNLICNSSPRGIVIFDMEGTISVFNSSALEIASLNKSPVGKCIYDIEPINLMLKDTVGIPFDEGTSYSCDEFRYKNCNNEIIYRYVMYPLYDYYKKLRGNIITIEDITEEKKIKDQIIEKDKNRALNQIVAGISHEIRNPLTTIKTFVELIPSKISNPKFREDLVNVVPQELLRVDKLIESLIDYSKPKSQYKTTFDIGETINYSITLLQPVLEENNINVIIDITEGLWIYADKSQIKQIIINFLLNAKDAILEKGEASFQGEIIIEGNIVEEEIVIKFKDNGIGIELEEIPRVFEMFYTTKEKGTGLGLSISLQMLEMNNATIEIESQKNTNTNITVKFPAILRLMEGGLDYEEKDINN